MAQGIMALRYRQGGSTAIDDKTRKPVGMAIGGRFKGYTGGQQGTAGYGGASSEEVQSGLRGQYVVPPPPGYIPGFNPEMMYFQDDPENPFYPAYGGPAEWSQMYAGSPINRFNPAGGAYFQPMIPGLGVPPSKFRNRTQPVPWGGGIASLPPQGGQPAVGGGGTRSGVPRPPGEAAASVLTPTREGRRGNEGAAYGAQDAGYAPGLGPMGQGRGFSINDYLSRTIPGPEQGRQLSGFQEGLLDNAGYIGMGAGLLTGIPGLGWLGSQIRNNWYMGNALQSPATNLPQSGNDMLNEAIDGRSSPTGRTSGEGRASRGRLSGPAFGGGGGWYYDSSGQLRFSRTGHLARFAGQASGGKVTLRSPYGPVQLAGGGIAEIPTEFTEQMPEQAMQQPSEEDVQMVAAAITGQAGEQADQIINAFIEQYGIEVFRAIREMVLQQDMPGAQTEGMIEGQGGGMDDQVMGMIGNQQPVAVSPGEYIVPADVVSGLGDGSSDAGAQELDRMMQNVRMARGGTINQPPPLDKTKVMPA